MKQPPTDVEIIATVRKWGNRGTTSIIRSVLAHAFPHVGIGTPWVLRQLKRLEREGKVRHVEQSTWKTQYVWSVITPVPRLPLPLT
jgi:hypothetical protein